MQNHILIPTYWLFVFSIAANTILIFDIWICLRKTWFWIFFPKKEVLPGFPNVNILAFISAVFHSRLTRVTVIDVVVVPCYGSNLDTAAEESDAAILGVRVQSLYLLASENAFTSQSVCPSVGWTGWRRSPIICQVAEEREREREKKEEKEPIKNRNGGMMWLNCIRGRLDQKINNKWGVS